VTTTIALPATTTRPDCSGCHRETETSSTLRAFHPWKRGGCPAHQDTPAQAVAARLRASICADENTRITVKRGEVTVEYVTVQSSLDMIELEWDLWADECGIPKRWQTLLISPSDTQVKARVRHGYVGPGMPCEYRRGVPVRLVAHGWTAAVERAEEMEDGVETAEEPTVVQAPVEIPIDEGAPLPGGDIIAHLTDSGSDTWWYATDTHGRLHHLHKYGRLLRYATGAVIYIEPTWAGWSSD
jgi:hypothetical protein